METTTPAPTPVYPVGLKIDYPDRKLNRLTSFFRIFVIIPIAIILWLIVSPTVSWPNSWNGHMLNNQTTISNSIHTVNTHNNGIWQYGLGTGSILFFPALLMILFRKKYPKWWFDWNYNLIKFSYRVSTYFGLMNDAYPSTDEEQWVHVELTYPDAKKDLMRGMPLVKWFLAIPHYIVLFFLEIAALVCLIIAWFSILFTGKYPKGMFNYVTGVLRWGLRVAGYAFLLVTDKYPPFSLD